AWTRSNLTRAVSIPGSGNQTICFQIRGAWSNTATSPTRTRTYTINIVRVPHVISFDTHGGSAVANHSIQHESRLGDLPIPTKPDYSFDGWWTAESGGTRVAANTVVTSDMTLHAKWASAMHTLTFDSMGADAIESMQIAHGAGMPDVLLEPKDGYDFVGWFTDASDGEKVPIDSPVVSDLHLFARWENHGAADAQNLDIDMPLSVDEDEF
ncbi:MAG: InlB B-repeat-containing protein, partial [Coriobacteriia bacterium]|nr:InlB B-repeat-containing protein [Coriobacteriia bacterium]